MNTNQNKREKVFVSGCYDMLHSGHVAFFKEASRYGDLYVGIGSDKTIAELKHRKTVYSEKERLYMGPSSPCGVCARPRGDAECPERWCRQCTRARRMIP